MAVQIQHAWAVDCRGRDDGPNLVVVQAADRVRADSVPNHQPRPISRYGGAGCLVEVEFPFVDSGEATVGIGAGTGQGERAQTSLVHTHGTAEGAFQS